MSGEGGSVLGTFPYNLLQHTSKTDIYIQFKYVKEIETA